MLLYLRNYLLGLVGLLAVTLTEKVIFALDHSELLKGLSAEQIVHAYLWGLRFDLAINAPLALIALFAAYILNRLARLPLATAMRYLTFIAGINLILLHGADMLYYGEAGRHLGYELTEAYNSGGALLSSAINAYALPVALQLLLIIPLWFLLRWLFRNSDESRPHRVLHRLALELSLLVIFLFTAIAARGGIQSVPLEPLHAQEVGNTKEATLALNGVYNAIFSSVTRYSIQPVITAKPTPKQLQIVRAMYPPDGAPENGTFKGYNVVLVYLESWTGAYMSTYGYPKETTPNFDQLRKQGVTVRAMLAGGHRTTEGMFATLCSTQNPLGETVAQTQLQNYHYECLPKILQQHGYHTAFFQGTDKDTSGTGAFAQMLGFEDSYGKSDVPNPHYGYNDWGLFDPDIYDFAIKKMEQMPKPFLVGINTDTTHDISMPKGMPYHFGNDTPLNRRLSVLHFADASLKVFLDKLFSNPRLKHTVVLIFSDHCGSSTGPNYDKYLIPFLLYSPGHIVPRFVDRVASQRDVSPTVLDALNLPIPHWFTGKSILEHNDPPYFADYYHQGVLGWIEGNTLMEIPLAEPSTHSCFSYGREVKPTACGAEAQQMHDRALAFTTISQSLLFSGHLKQFDARSTALPLNLRR